MLAFLATGPNGIPLRGLTRAWVLRRGLRLRDNRFAGFFAGTVYVLELLGFGGCRRVPESLYRKRVWPGSVHVGEWNSWDHERAMAAWVEHTLACLQAVVKSDVRPRERYVLIAACLVRLQRQLHRDAALDAPSEATPFDELAVTSALAARALGIDDPEGGLADLLKPDGALRRAISNLRLVEAVEQRDRGLPEAAGALFAAAAEIDPTSAEAPLQHSTIHYTLGRLEEGLVQARRAAELAPHDPRPRLMVSRLLAQKGELASAEEAARRALKLAPGNSQIEDHLALLARKAAGDERTA
jgi:tetratricopeptide (TPR) repeat protein